MKKFLPLALLAVMAISCDFPEHYWIKMPECSSTGEFEQATDFEGYSPADFRYKFLHFEQRGARTFMFTEFINDSVCVQVPIWVDRWDKLEGMLQRNGEGYPKELYDLKWELVLEADEAVIKYVDMHRIID
jgi:hypothetical protein